MYWEIFAIIKDNTVINIEVFEPGVGYTIANITAREAHGNNASAVNVTQYPVQIGDTYNGTDFYRNGVKVNRIPTEEERVTALEEENIRLNTAIDDITIVLLESGV